jgi:nickel-dependent lactate racemase
MQRIELNYGRGRLPVDLSEEIDLRVIRKRQMPVLPDPEGAVREALARPTAAPPLAELARGKASACILICDITRPVPNGLFLPVLVEQLLAAGLAAERIRIVVATGLHRSNEGEELAELVGSRWVMDTVEVANHFARDDTAHVDLGITRTHRVPVRLDRRLVEAELKIATGLVEPHFMAGWSGGRKVIAPGVAHRDTITTFHSARFMEHPRATSCVLEGNPLHETQLEIVEMLGGALALNTVIDEERRLSFVNFGEIVASHLEAVRHMSDYALVPLAEQFSTVVTSAAGYPLDKTYYQTVKGMVTPIEIMAPGADLIVASACSEGMGSPEFRDAQRRLVAGGPERFLAEISKKRFADIDEWQTEMQLKPMRIGSIQLYSDGLGEPERELTGVEMIGSVAAAVEASVARSGDRRVAVIPEGPYVVPVYRPAA